ncbi:MAG: putative bifunctional diguanylate cyclase/phosphodiesterase [Burkholderiaceae bacterium]
MHSSLEQFLPQATRIDPLEETANYGRWWLDMKASRLLLSRHAAHLLGARTCLHALPEDLTERIVHDDIALFLHTLSSASEAHNEIDFQFRTVSEQKGLRWLRMRALQEATGETFLRSGVLMDITPTRIAALRERFSYEVTQSLVGQDNLDEAVNKVLQLVCENLGWEWGAYWALDPHARGETLVCTHYWNFSADELQAFTEETCTIRFAPGEGFVGRVWSTGTAAWAEDASFDPVFHRRKGMRESGLQSGYIFPVSYTDEEGKGHRVGVLEFFSRFPRQCEAQLPNLSAPIGSLIAQTVLRMEQQERMRRLAQTDDLTGLANRAHFHCLLNEACAHASERNESFALLYIDLDRFKPINDVFGHDAGNAVLREFARRLQAFAPEPSHIGRLGGDEFAILAPVGSMQAKASCDALSDAIHHAATLPFQFEGHALQIAASIGMALFGRDGATSQELLRSGDAAMYRDKRSKRKAIWHRSAVSIPSLRPVPMPPQAVSMEAELRIALEQEELFLEYQPIIDNFSRRTVAIEALIRWRRADGSILRPDMFIPVAEKSRLIMQIGRWVFKRACKDLVALHDAGYVHLKVGINMAAIEFTDPHLPTELKAILDAHGIHPRHICLELTESTVMKHPEKAIPVMHALRRMGFAISLDDFGMGHSSLSRIKNLPITSLKIDRSFIKGLPGDRGDGAIVRTILELGRHMGLAVLAEGVETDAQLGYLTQFGCPLVQGYLLGTPAPAHRLLAAVTEEANASIA